MCRTLNNKGQSWYTDSAGRLPVVAGPTSDFFSKTFLKNVYDDE